MNKTKFETRELWLITAVEAMKPLFENKGYTIPKLRVSCGWPVRGGLAQKKRTLGECWDTEASTDKQNQIFISPYLSDVESPQGVLSVLVHEVCHAVVGIKAKHGKIFRKCAESVGLEGKMTSTHAGEELTAEIIKWSHVLGDYPHASLDALKLPKQSTRMIKMVCPECGYVARTSQKWITEAGPAYCPAHGAMEIEAPKNEDGVDNE